MLTPRGVAAMLIVATGLAAASAADAPVSDTAETILQKMAQAYRAVTSYQDQGVSLTLDPSKPSPDEINFKTFFARPNLMRFEWTSHHPYPPLRHLVTFSATWSNGTSAFTYTERPNASSGDREGDMRQNDNLAQGIAGATGVSRGAAHQIPVLLLPELGGFALHQIKSPTLVGLEPFDGTDCFRVRGAHPRSNGTYELWIGQKDYLIRRIVSVVRPGANEQEEIHRDIRIDRDIPRDTFEMKPAAKK
jgi:outer membrane lipoprotein-sorting protein